MIRDAVIGSLNRGAEHAGRDLSPLVFVRRFQVTSESGSRRTQPQRELLRCGFLCAFYAKMNENENTGTKEDCDA